MKKKVLIVSMSIITLISVSARIIRMNAEKQLHETQSNIIVLSEDIKKLKKEVDEKRQAVIEEAQPKWISLGSFRITYYGLDVGTTTASGAPLEVGKTIGVDPNVIPYGSQVMIDGHIYEAQDTGNYTGNFIDILCESEAQSIQLGTHYSEVLVLQEENK